MIGHVARLVPAELLFRTLSVGSNAVLVSFLAIRTPPEVVTVAMAGISISVVVGGSMNLGIPSRLVIEGHPSDAYRKPRSGLVVDGAFLVAAWGWASFTAWRVTGDPFVAASVATSVVVLSQLRNSLWWDREAARSAGSSRDVALLNGGVQAFGGTVLALMGRSPDSVTWLYAIGFALAWGLTRLSLAAPRGPRDGSEGNRLDARSYFGVMRRSVPIAGLQFGSMALMNADLPLVAAVASPREAAVYAVVGRIAPALTVPVSSFGQKQATLLTQGQWDGRVTDAGAILWTVVGGAAAIPILAVLSAGREWGDAVWIVLAVFAFGRIGSSIVGYGGVLLVYLDDTRWLAAMVVSIGVGSLMLGAFLSIKSVVGMALAVVGGDLATRVMARTRLRKYTPAR